MRSPPELVGRPDTIPAPLLYVASVADRPIVCLLALHGRYKNLCEDGTEVFFSSMFPSGTYFASDQMPDPAPAGTTNEATGINRGMYLMGPSDWVSSCKIDKSKRAWYLTFMLIFNTPYCIGFVMAFFLNLVLPDDAFEEGKAEDEAEDEPEDKAQVSTTSYAANVEAA